MDFFINLFDKFINIFSFKEFVLKVNIELKK